MPMNEEGIKELSEKLPEFYIDEVSKRIMEHKNNEDVIIISEEFSDK